MATTSVARSWTAGEHPLWIPRSWVSPPADGSRSPERSHTGDAVRNRHHAGCRVAVERAADRYTLIRDGRHSRNSRRLPGTAKCSSSIGAQADSVMEPFRLFGHAERTFDYDGELREQDVPPLFVRAIERVVLRLQCAVDEGGLDCAVSRGAP